MSKDLFGRIPVWLIITIVLLITASLILGWWMFNNYSNKATSPETENQSDTPPLDITLDDIIEPEDVRTYVGVIQSKQDNELSLLIPTGLNALKTSKTITVYIDARTRISKRIIAQTLSENPVTIQPATFDDLNIGDTVTVRAAENISTAESFTATRVDLQENN